jgi:hypothetical protein
LPQFHNNLYYPQLFDSELANFLSTKGLDVLLILSKNKKPMRTVDLSIKLQKTSNIKRSRSGGIGRLSYYLRKAKKLHLIESKKVSVHKNTLNKLTPKGIGIVNSINKFDNTMLGIESDGQIKLILDYKSKLGDKQP